MKRNNMKEEEKKKKFVLGQYFTKREVVDKVLQLLLKYKSYDKSVRILEPSAGTRNFIRGLNEVEFNNIKECELDQELTKTPCDFFLYPLKEKYHNFPLSKLDSLFYNYLLGKSPLLQLFSYILLVFVPTAFYFYFIFINKNGN